VPTSQNVAGRKSVVIGEVVRLEGWWRKFGMLEKLFVTRIRPPLRQADEVPILVLFKHGKHVRISYSLTR
jgi:hypothetical protein